MKISTNTASCMVARGSKELLSDVEAIKKLRAVGYDTVDISFVYQKKEAFILRGDDWKEKIEEVGRTTEEIGITISQCHFPYEKMHGDAFFKDGYSEYYAECLRRSYIAAGMLGVRYGVIHPITYPEVNYERKACLEKNCAYYDEFIELGIKNNVGTAIENMPPFPQHEFPIRYGQHYDDLLDFVDRYNDSMVGICWDTGHANLSRYDQGRAIRTIGRHLKALHMNDNHYGFRDEHLLPFLGEVDWVAVIEALVDIGYDGDLTYETGMVGKQAPRGPFQDAFLRATHENGMCMLQLYNETQKNMSK